MLSERKLTDGELKKRDEIVKAIKRDRKEENLTDEEVYAIATAQAKKTNEGIMNPHIRLQSIQDSMDFFGGKDQGPEEGKTPQEKRLDKIKKAFGSKYGMNYDAEFTTSRRPEMKAQAKEIEALQKQVDKLKRNIPLVKPTDAQPETQLRAHVELAVDNYLGEGSLVKNPARGVKAGTNMRITYRAGENLDRAMKYFNDFKSQQRKIQKLMHSAEMDKDGNLVITPRSTQGAKKIRSMMQDVLAPRKKETNENYDAGQPKPVRIRGLTGQRVTQVMKNMTPAQKARLMKKLGPKVRKLTKGGAFVADRIMQQNESYKRGGHMSQIIKQKLRDKRTKNIASKVREGQKRRQKIKSQGQQER